MNIKTHKFPPLIQTSLAEIRHLCSIHKVKQLWIFGSVLAPDFHDESDIDFLYEMDDENIKDTESYDCFWGFYDALKSLLKREIDMIWYSGIKNPYFKEEVDEKKILIYEQENEKVLI